MSSLVIARSVALAPPALSDAVSAYECGTPKAVSWVDAHAYAEFAAYDQRSVSIIAGALRSDERQLARFVSPALQPTIFYSDVGLSKGTGPAALPKFIRKLAPKQYELLRELGGPMVPSDPCGPFDAAVTVRSANGNAFVLRFRYKEGILVGLSAQLADLKSGEF